MKFNESMKAFEEATGIKVQYIGDKEFEARLSIAVDAGNAPDIADFPQPGKAATYVRQGKIVDPTTFISEEWLDQQYNQSWLDMAMVEGADGEMMTGGVWHRFNGKSLVWYPKAQFEAAGYKIPTTWQELIGPDPDQIADDGDTAWCIGIESGAATGWPATDWTEELMLRTTSLENYDAWVAGDPALRLPRGQEGHRDLERDLVQPRVRLRRHRWHREHLLWRLPGRHVRGSAQVLAAQAGQLHHRLLPRRRKAGVDYDFFYLPPVDDAYGKPFLVAGDLMAMFNDRPEVRALMEYFTTPQSASGWLSNGGALAAHQTATPEMYGVDLERGIAELVAQATSFRFDGSDLMPGEVGAGSFWTGMTDYVSGVADLDTVLAEIDASWPQ